MDPKILSLFNVELRRSDLQLLEDGSHPVSDSIIEFYFAYLSLYVSDDVLFVSPSTSFLLANAPDYHDRLAMFKRLNLRRKELIFFVVTDNAGNSTSSGGGSHQSLLVYFRSFDWFVHYDSSDGKNLEIASSMVSSVEEFVTGDFLNDAIECEMPRQRRGRDCGLYVMETARRICKCYSRWSECWDENWVVDMRETVKREYVETQMRPKLIRLITRIMERQAAANSDDSN